MGQLCDLPRLERLLCLTWGKTSGCR